MLIVIPVSRNEFKSQLNVFAFLKSIRHFGPYDSHELLVVSRPFDKNYAKSVFDLCSDLFSESNLHIFSSDGDIGWPEGPNFYWKSTIEYLKEIDNKLPWFWMEMDVTPLKPKWADILEKEYVNCNKPCMGTLQDTKTATKDGRRIITAKHLQGTAIYPPDIREICTIWEYVDDIKLAFDVICQWEIVPNTHDTNLIQQGFRTMNYNVSYNPFTIKGEDNGDMNGFESYCDPIDPNAVVHHGCKDTSLIDIVTSKDYDYWLKECCKNVECTKK